MQDFILISYWVKSCHFDQTFKELLYHLTQDQVELSASGPRQDQDFQGLNQVKTKTEKKNMKLVLLSK